MRYTYLLTISAIILLAFKPWPPGSIHIGPVIQTEGPPYGLVVLLDKKKTAYYDAWYKLSKSNLVADSIRAFASEGNYKVKKDSLFIKFDSVVDRISIIRANVFGKNRTFIERHYDPNTQVIIRGKIHYKNQCYIQIRTMTKGKDVITKLDTITYIPDPSVAF